jgi:intracellular septation protein A
VSSNQGSVPASQDDVDLARLKSNAPAIVTDLALGVLFFVTAKLTDLRTAALVAAGAGLALYPVQWLLDRWRAARGLPRLDLLGGLAMFGIVMLLLSAAFSWWFESELAVQMKATVIGAIGALFFGIDALRGGRVLGRRLSLYVAYADIDAQRLAAYFAAIGALLAVVNAAIALGFSKDTWLLYSVWGDMLLAFGLAAWAIPRARRPAATVSAPRT